MYYKPLARLNSIHGSISTVLILVNGHPECWDTGCNPLFASTIGEHALIAIAFRPVDILDIDKTSMVILGVIPIWAYLVAMTVVLSSL